MGRPYMDSDFLPFVRGPPDNKTKRKQEKAHAKHNEQSTSPPRTEEWLPSFQAQAKLHSPISVSMNNFTFSGEQLQAPIMKYFGFENSCFLNRKLNDLRRLYDSSALRSMDASSFSTRL